MAILPGKRLGPYEIISAIGAGGMGEVYRARDSKLGRDVALKVLSAAFAADAERMSRFEREARLLAALNHPNIAAIYGLEESSGAPALVMELVEGPTLADRIAAGPIPLDEALPIATQVAEALEYAHEKGIVHRDLKPANIKVKADGTVKVLDFGLAKALTGDPSTMDMGNSPTLSMGATVAGVILGTAAYMSPEQAKAKPADRRADIWAFGVVLYEMLTGRQLYRGETAAETLASVIKEIPDLNRLPASTSPAIRTLIARCLNKDLRQRLQHIGEARIALEDVLSGKSSAMQAGAETIARSREHLAWFVAACATVAALALAGFAYFERPQQEAQPTRFLISPPEGWSFAQANLGGAVPVPLAVSPDGRRLAFAATNGEGNTQLWIRALDSLTAQPLVGTEGGFRPFWAPDGRYLGFAADGKLKKIDISGGPPVTLCDAPQIRGATWSKDGVIVFAPTASTGLQKIAAAGGTPAPVTVLATGEVGHVQPTFLPDGRHFLYRANTAGLGSGTVYVASLDSTERKMLLSSDTQNVLYSQGYILFVRETTLMAQPFDAHRLELSGDPIPVAEHLQYQGLPPNGLFSVSTNGLLAYQTGTHESGLQLVWFDRSGKQVSTLGDSAAYSDLEFSPDRKRAAVSIPDQKGRDIWLIDLVRGFRTRFTFDSTEELTAIWSPDGSRIVFNSRRKGHLDLYQKSTTGADSEEPLLQDDMDKFPSSWSPDGRFLIYFGYTPVPRLFVLPLSGDRKPFPLLNTKSIEQYAKFSPNGRWVAYSSDESGRQEVYVVPFSGPGGKWQISTNGGRFPRWNQDGTEIFYLDLSNRMMVASVDGKGQNFQVGPVRPSFTGPIGTAVVGINSIGGFRYPFDVSADGQRFLINSYPHAAGSAPITMVLNWTVGVKK